MKEQIRLGNEEMMGLGDLTGVLWEKRLLGGCLPATRERNSLSK